LGESWDEMEDMNDDENDEVADGEGYNSEKDVAEGEMESQMPQEQ